MELVLHTLIYPHLFIFFVVWETQVNLSTMHVLQIVSHCYKSQENWEEKKVSIVIHDFLRGFSNLATWFHLIRYDKKLSRHAFCQHPKDHDKIEKRSVTWTKKKGLWPSLLLFMVFVPFMFLIQFWFYSTCHSWGFYSYFLTHTCFSDFLLLLL